MRGEEIKGRESFKIVIFITEGSEFGVHRNGGVAAMPSWEYRASDGDACHH